jgi:apolipoprotein N-acyltransferase
VLQVSTTGVSAIIDRDGHVVAESGALFTPAILTATVHRGTAQTDAVRWGTVPEWTLAGLALAAAVASVLLARRRTTAPPPAVSAPDEMVSP